MDLTFSTEERAFEQEVRDFIAANLSAEMKHAQSWRAERLYRGFNPDISRTADAQKMCFLRACRSGAMELRRSFRLIIF